MTQKSNNGFEQKLQEIQNVLLMEATAEQKIDEIRRISLKQSEHRLLAAHENLKREIGKQVARSLMLELIMAQNIELDDEDRLTRMLIFDLFN